MTPALLLLLVARAKNLSNLSAERTAVKYYEVLFPLRVVKCGST